MEEINSTIQLDPKEYNRLLQEIELSDIYMKKSRLDLKSRQPEDVDSFEYKEDTKQVRQESGRVLLDTSMTLQARQRRKILFSISATYTVILTSKRELPTEFFEIYKKTSLPLHTFPYFREYVNSMFSRCGMPPLILPLRKNLVGDTP